MEIQRIWPHPIPILSPAWFQPGGDWQAARGKYTTRLLAGRGGLCQSVESGLAKFCWRSIFKHIQIFCTLSTRSSGQRSPELCKDNFGRFFSKNPAPPSSVDLISIKAQRAVKRWPIEVMVGSAVQLVNALIIRINHLSPHRLFTAQCPAWRWQTIWHQPEQTLRSSPLIQKSYSRKNNKTSLILKASRNRRNNKTHLIQKSSRNRRNNKTPLIQESSRNRRKKTTKSLLFWKRLETGETTKPL